MTLDHWLVFNIHGAVLCISIMATAAALCIGATLIAHRFVPHHRLKAHNDIAGPIFNTLGVVYAVLLAFVMVMIWEQFDRIKINTEMEVGCLAELYTDAGGLEPSFRQEIRANIRAYIRTIIEEWDMLARGGVCVKGNEAIVMLSNLYSGYSIRNETEKIYFQESVSEVNELLRLRVLRLLEGHKGIHPLLWIVLIVGGVITIAFTIFFGSESLRAKILMSTFLAILIALILYTILDFSYPFTGTAVISAESFRHLLANLKG